MSVNRTLCAINAHNGLGYNVQAPPVTDGIILADRQIRMLKGNGGALLAAALAINGVDRVFCVPGESFLDVLDAFYDTPEIPVVVAKHEGAAANMAEADGKMTGRPGICFVTRGPGATHDRRRSRAADAPALRRVG